MIYLCITNIMTFNDLVSFKKIQHTNIEPKAVLQIQSRSPVNIY